MTVANRVILNTIILYAKILICMFISLWTVPLVLRALGANDYGLFNLIAGVIAMLSFINGAMTVSTQRYLSVTLGMKDTEEMNYVYNASILLHVTIGAAVIVLFELAGLFLFNGFLIYEPERHNAAIWLYQMLIVGIFFTITSVPFDAVLNAHENMLVFSIISIVESLMRLVLALSLSFVHSDLLIWYGCGIALISFLLFLVKMAYVQLHYNDMHINCHRYYRHRLFREMLGFTGWNTFGAMAGVGRIQGIALILNTFFGTLINAAYGIANQVNGVLNYFSTTIQKSINPQLMQSEGQGDRSRMVRISYYSSKYSALLISMLAIPLIIEAPYVLDLWLGDYPSYTVVFVRLVLIMSIINQLSAGIMTALQAVGEVKIYQLCVGSIILLNLPVAYWTLKLGYAPHMVLVCAIVIDIIALLARLVIVHRQIPEFGIQRFVIRLVVPVTMTITLCTVILYLEKITLPESFWRLLVICVSSVVLTVAPSWLLMMNEQERNTFKQLLIRKHNKK